MLVQYSNQLTACQSIVRIKQFQTRVSTYSGILDLAFTLVYGYFAPGGQFKTDLTNLFASKTCTNVGLYASILVIISSLFYSSIAQ